LIIVVVIIVVIVIVIVGRRETIGRWHRTIVSHIIIWGLFNRWDEGI